MNSITCPIPVPPRANAVLAHGSPLRALAWEMLWKSRVLLPALLVLWGVGAWLEHAIASAPPDDPGMISFRQTGVLLWLTSLILGFAPFTLMESHGGWRFSSMTTRWFVLPVPATVLVLLPLALGWAAIAAVHSAWSPLVQRLLPGHRRALSPRPVAGFDGGGTNNLLGHAAETGAVLDARGAVDVGGALAGVRAADLTALGSATGRGHALHGGCVASADTGRHRRGAGASPRRLVGRILTDVAVADGAQAP